MAKRKHHKPAKRTHRRRRVGAVSHHGITGMLESLGGLVVGSMVGTIVQRQFTSVNPKIISIGQMAAGIYLTKKPSPLLAGVGWGMASAGAIGFTHEVGLIHGIEETVSGMMNSSTLSGSEELEYHGMHGMSNETTLAGMNNDTYMSGMNNGSTLSGEENMMDPDRYQQVDAFGYK